MTNNYLLMASVWLSSLLFSLPVRAAELRWDPAKPDVITFSKPAAARFVRLTLAGAGSEPCLDEVELFAKDGKDNLALASTGAKATASSALSGYEIHQTAHLNDGKCGNSQSWIAATADEQWVQIELPKPAVVERVVVSRDRLGQYQDRTAVYIKVETSSDGKTFAPAAEIGSLTAARNAAPGNREPAGPPPPVVTSGEPGPPAAEPAGDPANAPTAPTLAGLAFGTLQAEFAATEARFVRVALPRGTGLIEELQLFAAGSRENLALTSRGARASASSHYADRDPKRASPYHVTYLNDGRYGRTSAWAAAIDRDPGPWAEIALVQPARIARVLLTAGCLEPGRAAGAVDVYLSVDGKAWTKVGVADTAWRAAAPAAEDGGADVVRAFAAEWFDRNQSQSGTDLLKQYEVMIAEHAARKLDVAEAHKQLASLAGRLTALNPALASPTEALAVFTAIRQAKRDLMFADPELAVLNKILFVKRFPYTPSHNYSDFMDGRLVGGGGVYVLDLPRPGERLRPEQATLTCLFAAGQGIARDVTLDWEAKTVWFAYMKNARAGGYRDPGANREGDSSPALPDDRRWNLYNVPVAGGVAQQVTTGQHHDYYPCVLPDGDIAFVTTRCNMRFLCWVPTAMTLYRMRPDGSNIRPISHNNISEWFPTVRRDGRIMWTRSEYQDKGADYGHTIWTIRPDGTQCEVVYGNNTPHNIMNAMEVPGRENELLATRISHFGDFAGPLCYIDLAKGPYDPSALREIPGCRGETSNSGVYRDPWPITKDLLLCSHKDGDQFSLYLFDRNGNRELLYHDAAIGCMTPVPLRARERPPLIPDATSTGDATMLLMDVNDGLSPTVERGRVKWLRICCELPSVLESRTNGQRLETYGDFMKYYASPDDKVTGPSGWPAYVAKEVVGVVPVEEDGSAHFTVPTGVMFYFQALDKDYNEIQRMCSIIQAQPGERRTCLGCHDDRLRTGSLTRQVTASSKPPATPQPPPWGAGPFWYERVVQPVLTKNCVTCHDGTNGAKKIDLTATLEKESQAPASYRTLIRGGYVHYANCQWGTKHAKPPPLGTGTLKSKLFTILADKDHAGVKLADAELQAVKCWIDLNCPLWGDNQHRDERAAGKAYCTASCPVPPSAKGK